VLFYSKASKLPFQHSKCIASILPPGWPSWTRRMLSLHSIPKRVTNTELFSLVNIFRVARAGSYIIPLIYSIFFPTLIPLRVYFTTLHRLLSKMSVYILKYDVSETGLYLRPHIKPTQLGPIDRASPHINRHFRQKTRRWIMSKNVIIALIYHCHKPSDHTLILKVKIIHIQELRTNWS
jgi:hypothetical protein